MGLFSGKKSAVGNTPSDTRDPESGPGAQQGPSTVRSEATPPAPGSTTQVASSEPEGGAAGARTMTPPRKTVSQVLGEVTWLLTQSPVHKQLFIGDLEWFLLPPLLLEQFRVFHGKSSPVAFALWARVSEETDQRLREGAFKLRPHEWKGGSSPWLIELVAPFRGTDELLADLSAAIFPTEAFNYHNVTANGERIVSQYAPRPKS